MAHKLPRNACLERYVFSIKYGNCGLWQMLLCGVLTLGTLTEGTLAVEALTPADVLKVLRAKDAEFDNAKLDYVTTGEIKTKPFPAWKFPGIAKAYGWEHEKPEIIPFRYNESLIVRAPNVTFIRKVDPASQPKNTDTEMLPFQKWSNTDGLSREITRMGQTGRRGDAVLEIRPGGLPVEIAQEQAMAVEFAHGFGFGKRIKQIDSIKPDGSRRKVAGTIQIWWEDQSRFDLLLDDHYIVREAKIESNVRGNHTEFQVRTEGTTTAEGFEFAKTGLFKRIALGREIDGKLRTNPQTVNEFRTEFKGIQVNLSDETYKALVAMLLEPGMQVLDHVADKVYFVGEEDKSHPLYPCK
jgi:hypothetical protein